MNEGHESHQFQRAAFITRLSAAIKNQTLNGRAHRQNHSSSDRELVQQRLGHMVRRSSNDNGIKGGFLRPPVVSISRANDDIVVPKMCQDRGGSPGQRLYD